MRRMMLFVLLLLPVLPFALAAQEVAAPVVVGQSLGFIGPAIDASGRWVVFGSGLAPGGALSYTLDLYAVSIDGSTVRRLTQYGSTNENVLGVHEVSLTPDGSLAAFAARLDQEQVHVLDMASGTDRVVAVDTKGCIQPMTLCVGCFFTCVNTPHISSDGKLVLYSVRRQNPFFVVNSDGTGLTQLPVYQGSLAPGPQRVISRNGTVVFSSSAPAGPTFAAAPTDIYTMDLAGQNVQNVTKFTDANMYAWNATISADASLIAFQSNMQPETKKPGDTTHIWVVKPDGTGLRPITYTVTCLALNCPKPGGQSPSISGDGRTIAYLNGDYPSGYRIFVVPVDGSGTAQQIRLAWSSVNDPVLAEDGTRVAFTTGPKSGSGRGAIYAAKTPGGLPEPVYAPRTINPSGVTSATPVAEASPGSLISVYGFNLTDDTLLVADRFPLPKELGGASLLVNGAPVPLLSATTWQLNAHLPQDVPPGSAQFAIRFADGTTSPASSVRVLAVSPGIYSYSYGASEVAAIYNAATGQVVDPAHPAKAGDVIAIFGSGLGITNPLVGAGVPSPAFPLANTVARVGVLVGGTPAEVIFAGLAPQLAGVYQVNAVVPAGLKAGSYAVQLVAESTVSAGFGSIAIQ